MLLEILGWNRLRRNAKGNTINKIKQPIKINIIEAIVTMYPILTIHFLGIKSFSCMRFTDKHHQRSFHISSSHHHSVYNMADQHIRIQLPHIYHQHNRPSHNNHLRNKAYQVAIKIGIIFLFIISPISHKTLIISVFFYDFHITTVQIHCYLILGLIFRIFLIKSIQLVSYLISQILWYFI